MSATGLESWGRFPKVTQQVLPLASTAELPALATLPGTFLAYGKGASYGDVCLNEGGTLLTTQRLDHFLGFDEATGLLRCEAGVTLAQVLELVVPRGWFLPVTPGTRFVTLGGALANDVHGKNHHRMGTFGEHVRAFQLARSDGSRPLCTPTQNAGLFRATIGGLGLTGLILWVEFQLQKRPSPFIAVENIKYRNLEEFFKLAQESETAFEHTVAWVDCLAAGAKLGRGIFMRGNAAKAPPPGVRAPELRKPSLSIPCDAPNWLLNRLSVSAFNSLYYHKQRRRHQSKVTHFAPFFYPLDAVLHWNRMYGRRGFLQYQFVVPPERSELVLARVLEKVTRAGFASFLCVMKTFGARSPAGMLSFPRPGVTLAMDLPNLGEKLLRLLDELDQIVLPNGGILYPAKDARMSPESFMASFPCWKEFAGFTDPRFSSSFWRRVTRAEKKPPA